jgi:hypothetical protein
MTKVKRVRTAPIMPKTIVIVRVYEASELFEPAATGSALAHGPSAGNYWVGEVDMTSKVINLRWEQRLVVSDTESMRR